MNVFFCVSDSDSLDDCNIKISRFIFQTNYSYENFCKFLKLIGIQFYDNIYVIFSERILFQLQVDCNLKVKNMMNILKKKTNLAAENFSDLITIRSEQKFTFLPRQIILLLIEGHVWTLRNLTGIIICNVVISFQFSFFLADYQ